MMLWWHYFRVRKDTDEYNESVLWIRALFCHYLKLNDLQRLKWISRICCQINNYIIDQGENVSYYDITHYSSTIRFIFNNNRMFTYLLRVFGHWQPNILLDIMMSLQIRLSKIMTSLSIASCSSWAYDEMKKVRNSMSYIFKSFHENWDKNSHKGGLGAKKCFTIFMLQ